MIGFDKEKFYEIETGALALKEQIEKIVDRISKEGYSNVFIFGIGGTIAHAMQMKNIVETRSDFPLYICNAGEFIHQGNGNFNKRTLVIVESVSGDTHEIVETLKIVKAKGARVLGFIDNADSPLAKMVDDLVTHETGVYYKLFYTILRLMHNAGQFPEYDRFCEQMKALPDALYDVKVKFDAQAEAFAQKYMDEPIHYLVGAGNTWGGTYSYAMCILEEMQWIRTKSVNGAEFFHGTLEVIDRDVSVILYKGEDSSRPIMDRVENFVKRVSAKVTVFDTKQFELKGISQEYRGLVCPFVVQAMNERVSKHLESLRKHPLDIRRYYRRLKY